MGQLAEWDNLCKSLERKSAPLLHWVSSSPVLSATQSNIACVGNYKLRTIVSNTSFALCSHFTGCFMQWSIKHHSDDRSYISSCSPGSCPLVALCNLSLVAEQGWHVHTHAGIQVRCANAAAHVPQPWAAGASRAELCMPELSDK